MPKNKDTIQHEIRLHFTHGHTLTPDTEQAILEFIHLRHKEKVDEFLEGISFILTAPYTLPHPEFALPLRNLLIHRDVADMVMIRPYSLLEPLPYEQERGYGGVFIAYNDGNSVGYVVGSCEKVLPLCKNIYDSEEFSRLHKKWHSSGFHTVLLASRDEPEHHRNILIRGLKGSLSIIALIGVREI